MSPNRSLSFVIYSSAARGYLSGSLDVVKSRRASGERNLVRRGVEVAVIGPHGNVIVTAQALRGAESLLLSVRE